MYCVILYYESGGVSTVFYEIAKNPEILIEKSKKSFSIAYELLDYKKLAARLYLQMI